MNKIKEFTDAERSIYSKPYVDMVMATEEIAEFLDPQELKSRNFYKKIDVLKEYLDKLDEADRKAEGEGLFEVFKSDDKYKDEVIGFKNKVVNDLIKLNLCHKCKCLTCTKECKFKSCKYCRFDEYIYNCDTERYYITRGQHNVSLYSNDEDRDVYFNVEGLLKDHFSNKQYIYLIEANNKSNQHILEYCKYVNGNIDYLPLDQELLDKIYDIFVRLECYE